MQTEIDDALTRQQLDGLLSMSAIVEIRYLSDLWTKLLSLITTSNIGCAFQKEEVIRILLELYSLNQLSVDTVIGCLQEL